MIKISVNNWAKTNCIETNNIRIKNWALSFLSFSLLIPHTLSLSLSHTQTNIHTGPLLEKLKEQIELCRSFANNKDECYAHITDDERDVLRNEGMSVLYLHSHHILCAEPSLYFSYSIWSSSSFISFSPHLWTLFQFLWFLHNQVYLH